MAAKKKNSSIRVPSEKTKKGRKTKAPAINTVPAAAATQVEATLAEPSPAITPVPAEAEVTRQAEALRDQIPRTKKLSALDAAAQVLGETGQAMTCPELIAAMAAKGYWSSPKGKTPAATLYAACLRELQTKGENARFIRTERGKFARLGRA
jgi:hypothetical protein